MKKLMLGLFTILFLAGTVQAQEAAKTVKKAKRALNAYNLSPKDNMDKLKEAVQLIEEATSTDELANDYDAWAVKGEIFNTIGSSEQNAKALADISGEPYMIQNAEAPMKALTAYQKALNLGAKKWQTKDALGGIASAVGYLNLYSNIKLAAQPADYAGAFPYLDAVLDAREVLVSNKQDDVFPEMKDFSQHQYVTAFCALRAEKMDRAKALFAALYEKGSDLPDVYSNYYRILSDEGDEKAIVVLEKGRELFPDNAEILFAEINEYIRQEKFDVLEIKLKEAIAREPDNPSVYSALGNVYMNLHTQEKDAGNEEKAEGYFKQSIEYYKSALNLDPNLFDAVYSVGSVYFNKAVEIVKEMNKLTLSKEDAKKYDVLGKQVDELFEKALPYFKQAEQMDPNDRNTMIALAEIFARQSKYELAKEFKTRQEVLNGGGKNESYFKNN